MKTLNEMLSEEMKNDEFRKEYEAIQPELDVIRAMVDARNSVNMTQKELSERTGISQAVLNKPILRRETSNMAAAKGIFERTEYT